MIRVLCSYGPQSLDHAAAIYCLAFRNSFIVYVASFSMLATGITALGETVVLLCRDTLKLFSALKQKPICGATAEAELTRTN